VWWRLPTATCMPADMHIMDETHMQDQRGKALECPTTVSATLKLSSYVIQAGVLGTDCASFRQACWREQHVCRLRMFRMKNTTRCCCLALDRLSCCA
jgi:hypothetical protein